MRIFTSWDSLPAMKWFAAITLCVIQCGWINSSSAQQDLPPIPSIKRSLPPLGNPIPKDEEESLFKQLGICDNQLREISTHPLIGDVWIYLKAVHFALLDQEWYGKKDTDKARALLAEAEARLASLKQDESPWTKASGLVVRGFVSKIDNSPQPYGLEIPEQLDQSKKVPLYVWLHGRGDKTTDLHFIHDRTHKSGHFKMDNGIVLHPFGRQCLGYKSAGETDVLEAIDHVKSHYNIDEDRIVLMGFSMGGAGAWHLGAHYTDRFCAVHPGAGFAETAQYNRLSPENYPPPYEQELWKLYDVPNYARNFLNVPLIAYSGELDKQKQAADVMAAALETHGHTLKHVIGPEMGHKYHPDSIKEITGFLQSAVEKGRDPYPDTVTLQTSSLRYNRMHWIAIKGMEKQWQDTRIDATLDKESKSVTATTKNLTSLQVTLPWPLKSLTIDGVKVAIPDDNKGDVSAQFVSGKWKLESLESIQSKSPRRQGPIDDIFLDQFLVVRPSKRSGNPLLDRWVEFELDHLMTRWRQLFRGYLPVVYDEQITQEELQKNLLVWGDPNSNLVWPQLDKMFKGRNQRPLHEKIDATVITLNTLPPAGDIALMKQLTTAIETILITDFDLQGFGQDSIELNLFGQTDEKIQEALKLIADNFADTVELVDTRRFQSNPETDVIAMIRPNPFGEESYVVFNSGPTFREGHDRTNSLQNPKLPDWAIIDLTQAPSATTPGHIKAAGFFNKDWEFTGQRSWSGEKE